MKNKLTTSTFWDKYWKSKTEINETIIENNYLFSDILKQHIPQNKKFDFLEIGGYPGYFSIFMSKYLGANSALLDRYINKNIVSQLAKTNGVNFIETIKGDLFLHKIKTKYDVVMSAGFIEHFIDTSDIIDRHLEFVKPKGLLILTVPNFLGINGYLQKKVDYENYKIHNLDTMYKSKILKIMKSKNVSIKYANYYGYFGMWMEKSEDKPFLLRLLVLLLNIAGKVLIWFQSKIFSPHFIIIVEKK